MPRPTVALPWRQVSSPSSPLFTYFDDVVGAALWGFVFQDVIFLLH